MIREKVKITQKVLDGIIKVRDEGKTNMFDRVMVEQYAFENKDFDTVIWIEEHTLSEFGNIIMGYFDIVD